MTCDVSQAGTGGHAFQVQLHSVQSPGTRCRVESRFWSKPVCTWTRRVCQSLTCLGVSVCEVGRRERLPQRTVIPCVTVCQLLSGAKVVVVFICLSFIYPCCRFRTAECLVEDDLLRLVASCSQVGRWPLGTRHGASTGPGVQVAPLWGERPARPQCFQLSDCVQLCFPDEPPMCPPSRILPTPTKKDHKCPSFLLQPFQRWGCHEEGARVTTPCRHGPRLQGHLFCWRRWWGQ